jgi:hypothetical protein
MPARKRKGDGAQSRIVRTFRAMRLGKPEQREEFRSLARIGKLKEQRREPYRVRISKTSRQKAEEEADAHLEEASGGNPSR